MTTSTSTTIDEPLACARRGWPVFPVQWIRDVPHGCSCLNPECASPGKHPLTQNGVLDATTDEQSIRAWWERYPLANYGVRTGVESGLVVLDVDPRNGGDEELEDLIAKHGPLPDTAQVLSGGGGFHYYFKHPGTRVRSIPLAAGLDIKSENSYVVGPGSRHLSGRRYEWELSSHPDDVPVAELPDWLLHLIAQEGATDTGTAGAKLPALIGAARNSTLTSLAGTLRQRGLSPPEIYASLQAVNQARCKPDLLEDEEVRAIAEGMRRYEPGQSIADEAELHTIAAPPSTNGHSPNGTGAPPAIALPRILTNNRPLRDVSDEALAALAASNQPSPTLFERGGVLVRVRRDEHDRPVVEKFTEDHMRGKLARVADFRSAVVGGLKYVTPPADIVADVLIRGDWGMPGLVGVVEAPVLRPDGSVLDTAGYDAATRLLYHPAAGLVVPPIPNAPSKTDVRAAIAFVEEAIGEFPYEGNADRCNAWGLLLTPILRPAIAGCVPLCLLDKPQAGTGASRFAEVVALVATGRPAGMMGVPGNEEEWRKQITSELLKAPALIVIDNVSDELGSSHLDRALTSTVWEDRKLTVNEALSLPQRATWIATGNNLTVRKDLARRCYTCRMDAQMAQPWTRTGFKHRHLEKWVREHRGQLLAALLTIARAWFANGCPDPPPSKTPQVGNFEDWARVVGGVLHYAGFKDFLGNLRGHWQQSDREVSEWEGFLRAWYGCLGDKWLRAGEVTTALLDVTNHEFRETVPDPLDDALDAEEAGLRSAKGTGAAFSKTLARALAKRTGTRYGDEQVRLLRHDDMHTKTARWQVVCDRPATPDAKKAAKGAP